ncbi:MAG: hypothetical protein JNK02_08280 [Planctomycetes bacterium]|nr:hypothetical protein [Planctomycetota bacterium]
MTDANWNEEPAPKRRRLPPWLWFCGGGCLIVLILGAIVIKAGFDHVKDWNEPEAQLPALRAVLPFDELPPETRFEFAIRFPMDWYIFQDTRGFVLFFFVAQGGDGEELRRTVLNPGFKGMGMGRRQNAEAAELTVQGREVRGLRFEQQRGSGNGGGEAEGPSIVLEVSPEGGSAVVLVQITRGGSGGAVTDDEVQALLAPFHVGPDR